MKKRIIVVALCMALAAVVLCGCSPEQKAGGTIKKINKTLNSAAVITQRVTVTDVGVTVYTYEKKSVADGDSVTVTVTEGKLGSDFTLQTAVTESVEDKTEMKLPLSLSAENLTDPTTGKNTLEFWLTPEQLALALDVSGVISVGNAKVTCVLSKGKLAEMNCSFTSSAEGYKSVTIEVTCEY